MTTVTDGSALINGSFVLYNEAGSTLTNSGNAIAGGKMPSLISHAPVILFHRLTAEKLPPQTVTVRLKLPAQPLTATANGFGIQKPV